MTYPSQLDFIGLFLRTKQSSRAPWWLLRGENTVRGGNLGALTKYTFSQLGVTQESAVPAAALLAGCSDWRLARRVVTYRRVEWAIDTFAPYKSPGVDGIFPSLLQQARELFIAYLVRIFRA
jgi:hypothetical protein